MRAVVWRELRQLEGHQGFVRAVRLHADGSARVRFEDGYEVQVPSVKETQ